MTSATDHQAKGLHSTAVSFQSEVLFEKKELSPFLTTECYIQQHQQTNLSQLLEFSSSCSSIDLAWQSHKSELKRCSMAHNCLQCIKYLMFVFNLLFWLGGCGILGVGIWLAVTQGNFATLSSSFPSLSAANLLIITGTFVMIIGFVGCIGAIKENKCLLLSFFIMLLIIFVLELTVVILFFVYTDKIDKYAQRDLKKGLHLYETEGNIGLTNAWSIIQTDFRCCGVSNYTDWFEVYNTTRVPDSCCLEFSENCGLHSPGTWWKAPCYETVKIWLQENLLAVGIFGLCTALVQILGLTFAMTMYCQVVKADTYCA
ncbi:tetraspanin-4 isoform X4 [Anolis sagrei]|uniref:tetraspanin-4 isoform X4 n=1 Tax=Anolis sagrei TaxID=38937 RepID=UPI0035209062